MPEEKHAHPPQGSRLHERTGSEDADRGRQAFCRMEWNALTNRARSILEALSSCAQTGEIGTFCSECPHALPGTSEEAPSCHARFRHTQNRLAELTRQCPASDGHQLRRVVDTLELEYRRLNQGEQNHA